MNYSLLTYKWTFRDGKNIVQLNDIHANKAYEAFGFNSMGAALGKWLEDRYLDRLKLGTFKGLRLLGVVTHNGTVYLDGSYGIDPMLAVAEAMNISIETIIENECRIAGFKVYAN